MKTIDPQTTQSVQIYKLLISLVLPRPIGWISTISQSGVSNLAPYSFFNMFSNNPPILGFSAAITRDGRKKDSHLNAIETGGFVHNIVTKELAEPMNQSSEDFPREVSEFEKVGLTPIPSTIIKAPRVFEAKASLECILDRVVSFGDQPGNGQLVLGKIVAIHIHDETILATDGLIDFKKLHPISRLGRNDYMDAGEAFELIRPLS